MSSNELQYERNRYSKLRTDMRALNQRLTNSLNEINSVIDNVDRYYKLNDNTANLKKIIETKNNIIEIQSNIVNLIIPSINSKIDSLDAEIALLDSMEEASSSTSAV